MTLLPSGPPVVWLRAASPRSVVQAHLAHLAGSFRADGWRLVVGPAPPAAEEILGTLAVLDDPWIEALPAAARALAEAKRRRESPSLIWRVPRLRGGSGAQGWCPARGPYTLHRARALAIDRGRLHVRAAPDLSSGFAVATAGEAGPLLHAGWPPPPELLRLVPGVRLYRYDDPADHERREIDPFVPDPARRVVDVGCGHGRLGARLRRPDRQVIGIEPDLEMARRAARRLDLVLAARAEEALPALGAPVDCFILADVLEHLADPARVLSLVAEALSPSGRAVVSIPNSAGAPVLRDLAAGRWEPTLAGVQARDHLRPFTLDSFLRLATESGLRRQQVVPLTAPLDGWNRLWAWFAARTAGGRPAELTAAQWIVVLVPQD
jgi:2-polyprenyl-3-methyl-5-hydroxy-6-metoxy-1,4-benzoquinol methylase